MFSAATGGASGGLFGAWRGGSTSPCEVTSDVHQQRHGHGRSASQGLASLSRVAQHARLRLGARHANRGDEVGAVTRGSPGRGARTSRVPAADPLDELAELDRGGASSAPVARSTVDRPGAVSDASASTEGADREHQSAAAQRRAFRAAEITGWFHRALAQLVIVIAPAPHERGCEWYRSTPTRARRRARHWNAARNPGIFSGMSTPHSKFRAIYDAHSPFVWCSLRRLGVRESDVMDLTQKVFLRLTSSSRLSRDARF